MAFSDACKIIIEPYDGSLVLPRSSKSVLHLKDQRKREDPARKMAEVAAFTP